jgi:hypothetical protein
VQQNTADLGEIPNGWLEVACPLHPGCAGARRLRQVIQPEQARLRRLPREREEGPEAREASFASFEDAKVAGSAGEEELRVNIPYEMDGQKQLYQCIAQKQADGTFKAVF